jgi:hypothetical protein
MVAQISRDGGGAALNGELLPGTSRQHNGVNINSGVASALLPAGDLTATVKLHSRVSPRLLGAICPRT